MLCVCNIDRHISVVAVHGKRHLDRPIGDVDRNGDDLAFRRISLRRKTAVCTKYAEADGLRILPAGAYLCADCSETTFPETLQALKERAAKEAAPPAFTLRFIMISGIARWRYQLQIPLRTK